MARLKNIERLSLGDMIRHPELYSGLADGLAQLPLPRQLTIKGKSYPIPSTLEDFTAQICYGQRLFLTQQEPNDFGVILRIIDGYYYKPWNEKKALLFGKLVLKCKVVDLYPIAMHFEAMITEMVAREHKLLHREPTSKEKAAGIDRLNVFSELTALDFLRRDMNKTEEQVLLTPYNECFVRFMLVHETNKFQEKLMEIMRDEAESKIKTR
jgi:hypothetical protein